MASPDLSTSISTSDASQPPASGCSYTTHSPQKDSTVSSDASHPTEQSPRPRMDCSSPLSSLDGSCPSLPSSPLSSIPSSPNAASSSPSHDASHRYPSPTSTSASGTQSPMKNGRTSTPKSRPRSSEQASQDGPPAKKRKVALGPKERRTDYLDLTKPETDWTDDDDMHLKRLVTALRKKKKIVVVAGAGISVSAGIPDFRSSQGLFAAPGSQQQKMKSSGKHLFDASVYRHDASTQSFHTMVREMAQMSQRAQPTPFHHLLASLAEEKRLLRLYSQNIDCLDTSMTPLATDIPLKPKGPWPKTVQLHGGLEKMVCTKCGDVKEFQSEIFDGPEAPLCETCKETDQVRTAHAGKRSHGIGRLRPRFVLYNEYNPDEEAIGMVSSSDLKSRPDAVIVVGTSLKVPGTRRLVKELCQVSRGRRDGFTAFINVDSEPKGVDFKDCWDLVVKAKCDKVAREVALPPWDCNIGDNYLVSAEELAHGKSDMGKMEVGILSKSPTPTPKAELDVDVDEQPPVAKPKQVDEVQAIPTPRPSPKLAATEQTGKKTKQIKLSFGNTDSKATTAEKKPATTKKGKPRKPLKTAQPKNTVANTFKATKAVERASVKDVAAHKKEVSKQPSKDSVVHKMEVTEQVVVSDMPLRKGDEAGLPSLRPGRRPSTEGFTYTRGSPDGEVVQPSTPVQAEAERPSSRDTISPGSKPRGLAAMIE